MTLMKIFLNNKYTFIALFTLTLLLCLNMYSSHGHGHSHSHGHGHSHGDSNSHGGHSNTIDNLSNIVSDKLKVYLADMSKIQQAYAGAFFISSSSFPIFILLTIFRIDNLIILLIYLYRF